MELSKSNMSIGVILGLMQHQEPEHIQLNHMVIEDQSENLLVSLPLTHVPSFTVRFSGFVDVEFFMDNRHRRVTRMVIQQSAMTFEELEANGEPLPSLSIACTALSDDERVRLDNAAQRYIHQGKMKDPSLGESLLSKYVEKAMFDPRRFGGIHHA